jgi:hypothetical protein
MRFKVANNHLSDNGVSLSSHESKGNIFARIFHHNHSKKESAVKIKSVYVDAAHKFGDARKVRRMRRYSDKYAFGQLTPVNYRKYVHALSLYLLEQYINRLMIVMKREELRQAKMLGLIKTQKNHVRQFDKMCAAVRDALLSIAQSRQGVNAYSLDEFVRIQLRLHRACATSIKPFLHKPSDDFWLKIPPLLQWFVERYASKDEQQLALSAPHQHDHVHKRCVHRIVRCQSPPPYSEKNQSCMPNFGRAPHQHGDVIHVCEDDEYDDDREENARIVEEDAHALEKRKQVRLD